MANTRKTTRTATSKTATKEIADTLSAEVTTIATDTEAVTIVEEVKKNPKVYQPDDLITCRAVVSGETRLIGKKTGNRYTWAANGDEAEVFYQDLLALKVTRSSYLFKPMIVIMDDELVEQWSELNDLYSKLLTREDINRLIVQRPDVIKSTLESLPKGILEGLKLTIGAKVASGELDSINRIKVFDEVLNTDFLSALV